MYTLLYLIFTRELHSPPMFFFGRSAQIAYCTWSIFYSSIYMYAVCASVVQRTGDADQIQQKQKHSEGSGRKYSPASTMYFHLSFACLHCLEVVFVQPPRSPATLRFHVDHHKWIFFCFQIRGESAGSIYAAYKIHPEHSCSRKR